MATLAASAPFGRGSKVFHSDMLMPLIGVLLRKDHAHEIRCCGGNCAGAVRATVPISDIARAWKPALDQVWAFLKTNGELGPGHNLFLYHHPERRNEAMNIDFGVQVARAFEREGDVRCIETPAGGVARTVHVGPYDRLGDAHDAIHAWCAANNRKIARASWEIYGDWNDDPALLETTIKYLLA